MWARRTYNCQDLTQINIVAKECCFAIAIVIISRLHYCNPLYVGLDQSSLHRLQLVQNSASRLLTGTKKREHITPVLASLHWLPVRFRIDFKILLLVFKILNGMAPPYLSCPHSCQSTEVVQSDAP